MRSEKKIFAALATVSLVGLGTAASRGATVAAYDGFDYTTGTAGLAGQDGGTGWVVPDSGSVTNTAWSVLDGVAQNVVAPSLTYAGLQTSTGNAIQGNTHDSGTLSQSERSFSSTVITSGTI